MNTIADLSLRSPRAALVLAGALLVAELGAIGVIFKHAIEFECLANWPAWACSGASGALVAMYCLLGALVLFGMLRPRPLRDLARQAGERLWPLALNAGGVVLALIPVAFLREGSGAAALITAGLFATLHDRRAEAFVAGLVFSALALRRRRIVDSIVAHSAANAIMFAVAEISGTLNII